MVIKTKQQTENDLVEHILAVGLEGHAETDEGRKTHFEFRLADGSRRYWTNMSDENLKRLGIGSEVE